MPGFFFLNIRISNAEDAEGAEDFLFGTETPRDGLVMVSVHDTGWKSMK
jgi:hypothetical protein